MRSVPRDVWLCALVSVVLLAGSILLMLLTGCSALSTPRGIANATAYVANETLPVLVLEWTREADTCVDRSATREAADDCIARVDAAWLPMFQAYDDFAAAHDLYRKVLESGTLPAQEDLRVPYCHMRLVTAGLLLMPDFPTAPC